MSDLICQNVTIRCAGAELFAPLSVSIAPGTVCAVMGPSGCGKSSLIAYIAGLLPDGLSGSGEVSLGARVLNACLPEQRRVGLLFQDDLLFPHLSVAENLAFGLPSGLDKCEKQTRIARGLEDCGLAGYGTADPATLSGGQRARIAMQRLLLSEPECLLLDEPFSKLDQDLRAQFRHYVFDHVQKRQLPTLMVTHDTSDTEHCVVSKIYPLSTKPREKGMYS